MNNIRESKASKTRDHHASVEKVYIKSQVKEYNRMLFRNEMVNMINLIIVHFRLKITLKLISKEHRRLRKF